MKTPDCLCFQPSLQIKIIWFFKFYRAQEVSSLIINAKIKLKLDTNNYDHQGNQLYFNILNAQQPLWSCKIFQKMICNLFLNCPESFQRIIDSFWVIYLTYLFLCSIFKLRTNEDKSSWNINTLTGIASDWIKTNSIHLTEE